jgi:hypothetical protein
MAPMWRLAIALVVLAGCSRPDSGFDGIGPWHVGKTTMKDAVRCDPPSTDEPDLHWCYLNPELTFAEHRATVDLYFRGQGDGAPLVEILVGMASCRTENLDRALTSRLGPAPERSGTTYVWTQPAAIIVARMPSAPGECELVFLAPGEAKRLAALRAKGAAAERPPAATPPPAAPPADPTAPPAEVEAAATP